MQCTYDGLVAGELGPHVWGERDEGTLIAHCITAYRGRGWGGGGGGGRTADKE